MGKHEGMFFCREMCRGLCLAHRVSGTGVNANILSLDSQWGGMTIASMDEVNACSQGVCSNWVLSMHCKRQPGLLL